MYLKHVSKRGREEEKRFASTWWYNDLSLRRIKRQEQYKMPGKKKTYDDVAVSISTAMTIWSEDGMGLRFLRLGPLLA